MLAWTGGVVAGLVVLIVVAALVALHSQTVHRYVLRLAQKKATEALGTEVRVGDFSLHFSGISPVLDINHIVVQGREPSPSPPLAQAESLHLGVTVTSLLHRRWYVNDITLSRPVVHFLVDAGGTSNLPPAKNQKSSSQTNVFDLGVRHARIENGELYYNDRKSSINADLQDLEFESRYDAVSERYLGTLGYRDGHLTMENFAPVRHQLQAEFEAGRERFRLRRAILRSGDSSVELTATAENYANPKLDAEYRVRLDAGEFRRILKNASLPVGILVTDGKLAYQNQTNRPMLDLVRVNGKLTSTQLLVENAGVRMVIGNLGASYNVADGNMEVPDLRARVLGGELLATLRMRDLSGATRSHLVASLRSASLPAAQALGQSPTLRSVGISGTLDARADARWGKTIDDLVAQADASINAAMAAANDSHRVPVNGSLHARYEGRSKQVQLANSFLRTPQTSITMAGLLSNRSSLDVKLVSTDLHEFETLTNIIHPGAPPLGLYGGATIDASVSGSTAAPRIRSQLNATNLRVKNTPWRLLRASINADPSQVNIADGLLEPGPGGQITFSMKAGLNHWAFAETSPVEVALDASQINMGAISRAASIQTPVSGMLTAHVSLRGSEQRPLGQGSVSLTRAKIQDELVDAVNLNFQARDEQIQGTLATRMPAGATNTNFAFNPKQKTYQVQLASDGIRLDQLQTVKARNVPIQGVLNLNAQGAGSLENPGFHATLTIPELSLRGQKMSAFKFESSLVNHVAKFNVSSQVIDTAVNGQATVQLSGDYLTEAALDTQAIPFEPLLAAYAPAQSGAIGGQTELHARLRGPLKQKDRLEAELTIPTLAVHYKNNIQIAATGPIHADYRGGVLEVQRSGLRGTGTDLQFQGRVPLTSKAPASLLLQGSLDLQLAQMFDPDITSSGQLRFDVNSYGQRQQPNVHGEIHIVNADISTTSAPLGLQNGNGVVTLLGDRLQISQFHGVVGGGDFSASGGVVYRPALRFDVALAGRDTRLLYNNVRGAFDTKLALLGDMDSARLQGQVTVTQLQFTPAFDLMDFMGTFGGGASTPPPIGGFQQALALNVGVDSSGGVNLVSRTMSLQAGANLRVTGTAAQPVILGRVNLNGGDLIYRGNRYVLQGGTIDFINPSETQAVVNVSANTEVQQFNVQMHFWGPVDHLHTNYSSDPALPPSDIINLIAFGKTQEASAANPNPPGNLAAEQAVASQVSSLVTSRVEKVAGLSQLSVDPLLGSNQGESPGARVTVQQRMTGKIFVTFSTDVTSTQNSTIKLEYHQSPKVSYSGTRDQNGGFGFDRRIHKEW